jgi:hypothetical protein
MIGLARLLIIGGILLVIIGIGIYFVAKTGIPLGRLPGDIRIEGENFSLYIPLASMILISVVLTIVLNIIVRWLNR